MLTSFCLQSFNTLHMMYHEATACHVTGDLVELLSIFLSVLKATHPYLHRKGNNSDSMALEDPVAPCVCACARFLRSERWVRFVCVQMLSRL